MLQQQLRLEVKQQESQQTQQEERHWTCGCAQRVLCLAQSHGVAVCSDVPGKSRLAQAQQQQEEFGLLQASASEVLYVVPGPGLEALMCCTLHSRCKCCPCWAQLSLLAAALLAGCGCRCEQRLCCWPQLFLLAEAVRDGGFSCVFASSRCSCQQQMPLSAADVLADGLCPFQRRLSLSAAAVIVISSCLCQQHVALLTAILHCLWRLFLLKAAGLTVRRSPAQGIAQSDIAATGTGTGAGNAQNACV